MISTQQFPALPAEEERYRQVLSASRVRRTSGRSLIAGAARGPGHWGGAAAPPLGDPRAAGGPASSGATPGPAGSSVRGAAAAGLSGGCSGKRRTGNPLSEPAELL